jgi:hypothetical protein
VAQLAVNYSGALIDGLELPVKLTSPLSLPDTATLAQAVSGLGVWAAAMDGVTDGAFRQVWATIQPALPGGLKAASGATWAASDITKTGIIDFSATGTARRWGQAIPTLAAAVIVNGKIDVTNAAIIALVDLLTNPTGFFTNADQQSLEAALDALISFRQYLIRRLRSRDLFS